MMLVRNVGALLFGVALAARWGLAGAVIGECFGVATALALMQLTRGAIPAPRFLPPPLLAVLRPYGLTIGVSAVATVVSRNVDRVIVVAALGVSQFAQYNFGMILVVAATVAVNAIVLYVTPRVCFGAASGVPLRNYVRGIDAIVGTGLVGGLVGAAPIVIFLGSSAGVFSDYAAGIDLVKWLWPAALLQISTLYQSILIAVGASGLLFRQSLVVGAVTIIGSGLAAVLHLDLSAFALAFTASRAVGGVLLVVAAHRHENSPVLASISKRAGDML